MTLPQQKIIRFGTDYSLSIVDEINHADLFECAVFHKGEMVEMPGITAPDDTVVRFRTAAEVEGIMKKMFAITGVIPENG